MFSSVGWATSYFSYASQDIAHFVPNFVAMATEVGRGKMRLATFDGPSRKTPYRRKNLPKMSYASPSCPKFRCHGNGGRSEKNAIGSIRWPIPENPPIGAKISQNLLHKLSYSPFCPKFRCHGNQGKGKGTGKENGEGKGEGEGEGKGKVEGR